MTFLVGSSPLPVHTSKRMSSIDQLRGIASISVVFFHFIYANAEWPIGLIKSIAGYGFLGVEAFFVISGFIIPYSLKRSGYEIGSFPTFLYKRIVRLDPPYIASILLIIALWMLYRLKPGFSGPSPFDDKLGLLLHLGYLNAFFGHPWLNPAYWTLAIEFQYYILAGLIFAAISNTNRLVRLRVMGLLAASAFVFHSKSLLFIYLPLFLAGMVLFQYLTGLAGKTECGILLTTCFVLAGLTLGLPYALAGLFASIFILFVHTRISAMVFLGEVSYSLYLVHFPVGTVALRIGKLLNLGLWSRVGLALAASLFVAYLFYRVIEKPMQQWSSAIKYKSREAVVRLEGGPHAPPSSSSRREARQPAQGA